MAKSPSLAILTLYDNRYRCLAVHSGPNKRRYARRQGYAYLEERGVLDLSRPPAWSKVRALLRYLPRFEWIFWSDVDSLIMNPSIPLESFLDDRYDMIVSADSSGMNTGHFLLRRSEWSLRFLEEVYRQEQFIHHPWWEQMAMLDLLRRNPGDAARVKILEKRELNAYIWDFQEGDFLVHFVYDKLAVRRLYMKSWSARANGSPDSSRRWSSRSSSDATSAA